MDVGTARLAVDQKVADDIKEYGLSVLGIFPTGEEDEPTSAFNYTVGMTDLGQPEVIVVGADLRTGQYICNEIHRRVKDEGLELAPGVVLDRIVGGGYQLVVCAVNDEHEANMARSFFVDPQFVQVVFPDQQGNLPWDAGYTLDPRVQKTWWIKP